MQTSTKRTVSIFSLLIISLTASLALAGQNCPSSMKLQSTKQTPIPAMSEQLAGESDEAEAKRFLNTKKQQTLTAEQVAAANLKCYAALHRDLDDMVANESCDVMPSNTAHIRGQKTVQ
ncbi:MAG: hypothetical protein RL020_648 [Pseudomonadota bacterium]